MKRTALFVLGVVALSAGAFAQAPADAIEKALSPAPRNMKEGAAVIKFKADGTYDTLKPGTNRLVCYDRSGDPGQQPFAVQCTSVANIPRVAQNRKFEAITDKAARQAAIDAAEKDGQCRRGSGKADPGDGDSSSKREEQGRDDSRSHGRSVPSRNPSADRGRAVRPRRTSPCRASTARRLSAGARAGTSAS